MSSPYMGLDKLLFALLLIVSTSTFALWVLCYRKYENWRDMLPIPRSAFMVLSVCFTIITIELGARAFVDMSDFNTPGVIQQVWYSRHWQVNSLGYRDREPYPDTCYNILIVGDSFVAGYGIPDIQHTLAQDLGFYLYRDCVNIAAEPGDNTEDELRHLRAYPLVPDMVIWSHHVNDINDYHPPTVFTPQVIFDALMGRTYITDYAYFHIFHTPRIQPPTEEDYAYHLDLLDQVYAYVHEQNIPFIFVSWDYYGQSISSPILEWANVHNIRYVDMLESFTGNPSIDYASPLDGHPSEYLVRVEAWRLTKVINDSEANP